MLLTITTTHRPATDLGHLLRKHPQKTHTFEQSFGRAHVFYPEAGYESCTAALLLEIDPVGLVRSRRGPAGEGRSLEQHVNDRPYAASSFLSVAIAEVFGSAMSGKAKECGELVDAPIPLKVTIPCVPCRAGETLLERLFGPLGYAVTSEAPPLDDKFPDWGQSHYYAITLKGTLPLRQLLTHLYVLLPVLDNDKHYWVGDDEVNKLLRRGEGWLSEHPERELIARRYLKHRRTLVDDALAQLTDEDTSAPEAVSRAQDAEEASLESALRTADCNETSSSHPRENLPASTASDEDRMSLNQQRLGAVLAVLKSTGARRVLDLGCGEGRLLRALLHEKQFEEIAGMDVSYRALEIAQDRLHLDRLPPLQRQRLKLLHGSLIYRDQRLAGFDAAAVVEVIEHLDPARLAAFERVLFECARPGSIVITTPNREYNVKWETLPAGQFRHRDHRFEWTRSEFRKWSNKVAGRFGYSVRFLPVGPEDPELGAPTQMGIFERKER